MEYRGLFSLLHFTASYKPGMPVVIFGLLPHEHKMSVINFLLKRVPEYRPPIKSKDRLIFHVGFKRYSACPVFSQHTNASKHKVHYNVGLLNWYQWILARVNVVCKNGRAHELSTTFHFEHLSLFLILNANA